MTYLLTRAAAQGLQAFVPVAVLILWLQTSGRRWLLKAVACGIAAAFPATIAAGVLFARAQQQARWEAALAAVTLALAGSFAARVFAERAEPASAADSTNRLARFAVAAATTIMITRQTMEIFTVLAATGFDLRMDGPAVMTLAGAMTVAKQGLIIADLIDRLSQAGYRYLDLGPSASDQKFNKGVSFFKEALGASGQCRDRWRWDVR